MANTDFITYLRTAKALIASTIAPSYKNLPENIEYISPVLSNLEQMLYVFDLENNKFTYLSDNSLNIMGYPAEELYKIGPEKFMEMWHEKDFEIIVNTVFSEGLDLIKKQNDSDISKHKIAFTYRLKQKDGSYRTLLNQFSHVLEDENRNPLVLMGTTSNISEIQSKPELFCRVTYQNAKGKWEKIYERFFSLEDEASKDYGLTPKEYEIIRFIHQGLSSKEIANRTNRSTETIKSQRKSILSKTGCASMIDVIVLANKNGWL